MNDKPGRNEWAGWSALICAVCALTGVTAVSLCRTPMEIAASRLRIGMSQGEAAKALSPEVTYRPKIVFWDNFSVKCRNGLRMTFREDKLTDWQIETPLR